MNTHVLFNNKKQNMRFKYCDLALSHSLSVVRTVLSFDSALSRTALILTPCCTAHMIVRYRVQFFDKKHPWIEFIFSIYWPGTIIASGASEFIGVLCPLPSSEVLVCNNVFASKYRYAVSLGNTVQCTYAVSVSNKCTVLLRQYMYIRSKCWQ